MKWLGLWLVLALVACSQRTRCERICEVEARCADQLDVPDVDRAACVEACSALDRDPVTKKRVSDHVKCVDEATTCQLALECL